MRIAPIGDAPIRPHDERPRLAGFGQTRACPHMT